MGEFIHTGKRNQESLEKHKTGMMSSEESAGEGQKHLSPGMKIALVSTGLGRVLRGFESFTSSLFDALTRYAPELRVTLFQGGGKGSTKRVVVPNFHRFDAPGRWLGYEKGNLLEKRSFALSLYPILRVGGYDIVHYNELVMGSALYHLRRVLGGRYKLLYCAGSTCPRHIITIVATMLNCSPVQCMSRPSSSAFLNLGFS